MSGRYTKDDDIAETTKFRYQSIKGKKHYNFRNEDEFLEFFGKDAPPLCRDWRNAEEGDWVVADDGGVVQILKMAKKIKHPKDSLKYSYADGWCRTVVGTFIIRNRDKDKFKMDTDWSKHGSRYTFTGTSPFTKFGNKRDYLTAAEKKFVFAILFSDIVDFYSIYAKVFTKTKPHNVKRFCNELLKEDRIVKEIEKGVREAAERQGLSHEWVLERLKYFAENSEQDADAIRAVEKVGKALGTFNQSNTGNRRQLPGAVGLFGEVTEKTLDEIAKRPKYEGTEI